MSRRRAFTLIEILIVIAIMAILSAAGIAVYTAPAEERVRADEESAAEAGMAVFFTRLQQAGLDATRAGTADGALMFYGADAAEPFCVFGLSDRRLYHQVPGSVAAVLYDKVDALEVEPLDGGRRLRVSLLVAASSAAPSARRRSMEITIGRPWLRSGASP